MGVVKTSEYTLEITTYCHHGCDYCSTNAMPDGKHIDMDTIKRFLSSASELDRINISGGEPLAHPHFWDILQYCRGVTRDVWIYTNALDKIRYNSGVLSEITVEANVCLVPGKHVYIPKGADKVHLLQLIPQGRAKNLPPANIHVSGNLRNRESCQKCDHKVLQANGIIADGPCKKHYD